MLGLKQFSTPQFMVPVAPENERPLHKMKDLMSFLNSLQWKVKDKAADDTEPQTGILDTLSLDWNIGDPFIGKKLGSEGIEDMTTDELRNKANESLVHGGTLNFGSPLEYGESVDTPKERTNPLSDEDKEIAENFGKTIDDLWYNAVRKGRNDAYWDKAPFMTPEGRI